MMLHAHPARRHCPHCGFCSSHFLRFLRHSTLQDSQHLPVYSQNNGASAHDVPSSAGPACFTPARPLRFRNSSLHAYGPPGPRAAFFAKRRRSQHAQEAEDLKGFWWGGMLSQTR